jgi:adenylylsulfate kinase
MNDDAPDGFAVWFTGLPASGKTTLARALQRRLADDGIRTQLLDSDALRERLVPEPTFTEAERDRFYDLVSFLAALLTRNGVNVLIAATAQKRAYRRAARTEIERFCEVYIVCSPTVCRRRDPKGLWAKADQGQIQNLPGADAVYEVPTAPDVVIQNDTLTVEAATALLYDELAALGLWT